MHIVTAFHGVNEGECYGAKGMAAGWRCCYTEHFPRNPGHAGGILPTLAIIANIDSPLRDSVLFKALCV